MFRWRQQLCVRTQIPALFNPLLSYGLVPSSPNPDESERNELATKLGDALPEAHGRFLRNLQLSLTCGDFFFVHAGVKPGIALDRQEEEDLVWIRDDFLLHEGNYEKMVIHGHSPVVEPEVRANRINIDTGAYATGKLTCLILERDKMHFI